MASIMFNIERICHSQFKCNYLKKEKHLLNVLFHYWNLHQILNILKLNMMVIANGFPKLETVNNFVRPLCENPRVGTCFDSEHVTVSYKFPKCPWENFFHVFSSFWEKLIWKISPRLFPDYFLNTLIADGKYPVEDCENSQLPIQMQLSEKQKVFSEFFVPFLEYTSNFKHFEIKDDRHS